MTTKTLDNIKILPGGRTSGQDITAIPQKTKPPPGIGLANTFGNMAVNSATDKETLDARQRLAAQIDSRLRHSRDFLTPGIFEYANIINPDYDKAGLSDKEVSDYITRKKRENLADEIKSSNDPLGYVQGIKGNDFDELPGGVSREQAVRLAKLTQAREAGKKAGELARTPYQRPEFEPKLAKPMERESDKLSAKELKLSGYSGLSELREMQNARERGEGFKGMGKGRQLTTPAQKMRRAARMAERKGNSQDSQRLFKEASDIDPEITTFFRSPEEREAAKSSQKELLTERARRRNMQ